MVQVTAIKCPRCLDTIYSRAHHDFHSCTCGAIDIDGGRSYLKYGWISEVRKDEILPFTLNIEGVSEADLYDDWNKQTNKYGIIKHINPTNRIGAEDE